MNSAVKRLFFGRIGQAFTRWKDACSFEDHKQKIMKHAINNWRLRHARVIFTTLKNNLMRALQDDEKNKIQSLDQQIVDMQIGMNGDDKEYQDGAEGLNGEIGQVDQQARKLARMKSIMV